MGHRARHVFRWDLDKTYLRTEFDSIKDLLTSAMEEASDKRAYPGAAALLRSLRQTSDHRICIVSGSPSQMRKVLTTKLALDGIEFDEFVLKNNLHNLLRFRFRALRSQVPFKLPALLESRGGIIGSAKETLFGDDSEADGVIYALYADLLAGTVDGHELKRALEAARAYPEALRTAAGAHL
jgi:phosphatidate phosphatase APP1